MFTATTLCLILLLARPIAAGEPSRLKTDQHGDPLPPGAIARLGTLRFRPPALFEVAWSPDGKTLASSGYRRPIRLWDVATGKEIRRFDMKGTATVLAWSPDGKMLAS